MALIGWILLSVGALGALRAAYRSVQSHRGMRILLIPGAATALAVAGAFASGATWVLPVAIGGLEVTAWLLQAAGPWPFARRL